MRVEVTAPGMSQSLSSVREGSTGWVAEGSANFHHWLSDLSQRREKPIRSDRLWSGIVFVLGNVCSYCAPRQVCPPGEFGAQTDEATIPSRMVTGHRLREPGLLKAVFGKKGGGRASACCGLLVLLTVGIQARFYS